MTNTSRWVPPTLPVELLRGAIARAVVQTSLRQAAREISISPNGLRNFINGAAARPATCLKLERWIARRDPKRRTPSEGRFIKLLNEVAADLTPRQAGTLAKDVAALIAEAYEIRHLSAPRWLTDMARLAESRRARIKSASA
ncbi:MAG TPA: hypothetical protein VLT79_06570 [Gemmatimonadales bacterium]|nr:hypothetical protein [Gemmatimonadales bacterium]